MALAAARQDLKSEIPTESLGLVFGTGYGGLGATGDFLGGVATRGPGFGRPTAFHQSLHHSPAGQASVPFGLRRLSPSAGARGLPGQMAPALRHKLLTP